MPARRLEVDHHRRQRVIGREEHVELETAVGVRRVGRTSYEHLRVDKKHDYNNFCFC